MTAPDYPDLHAVPLTLRERCQMTTPSGGGYACTESSAALACVMCSSGHVCEAQYCARHLSVAHMGMLGCPHCGDPMTDFCDLPVGAA